jgi:hypothetical protein
MIRIYVLLFFGWKQHDMIYTCFTCGGSVKVVIFSEKQKVFLVPVLITGTWTFVGT